MNIIYMSAETEFYHNYKDKKQQNHLIDSSVHFDHFEEELLQHFALRSIGF